MTVASQLPPEIPQGGPVRFAPDAGFHADLRRRVDAYFTAEGLTRRPAEGALLVKAAILLGALVAVYVALVLWASTVLQVTALSIACGGLAALVGFNIQHDGGHQSFSRHGWRNRAAACTLDLIGASSYLWRWKHAVFHHGFANVAGQDTDITVGRMLRLEPHQERLPAHRWQHLYVWVLYGLMTARWQLYDDVREVIQGRIGPHRIPRPQGRELAIFLLGKAVFVGLALVLPLCLHPVWAVLAAYALAAYALGFIIAVVFQLAHNSAACEFPLPDPATGRFAHSWAEHQIRTTADFARDNRWATWLLGGLNFQVEHHLFPHIAHIHYPALSPIVEATCRDHGLRFRCHPTFAAGLAAHFHWLRQLGLASQPLVAGVAAGPALPLVLGIPGNGSR